ncbi:minor tail protein [Mycobacterium phage Azrael100]|nr:minor tail protein [Mycobacterium phage Azrael100]
MFEDADEYPAKIEIFGWQNTDLDVNHPHYFCISGDGKGEEGAILRPNLKGAIDAPVKSLWLPGAFGQVFVDFRWQRRDVVFTVFLFDPGDDTASGFHTIDARWRACWDYVRESTIRWTYQDETMDEPDVRIIKARMLEEPKSYSTDPWEGKDPHLYHCANIVMTTACELPFYQAPNKVYTWVPEVGEFAAEVDFSTIEDTEIPVGFELKSTLGSGGGMQVVDGKWVWVSSGSVAAEQTYLYTAGEPETDFFEVAMKVSALPELGFNPGDTWLIGRSDDDMDNFVFCKIEYQIANLVALVTFGYVKDGGNPVPLSILPTVVTGVSPGDTWYFAGTGNTTFRLKLNDRVVARGKDTGGNSRVGADYRGVGFKFAAAPTYLFGQHEPAPVSLVAFRDVPTADEQELTFEVTNDGDVPCFPRWTLTGNADWTLPDYSFGNEEYGRPIEDADREVPLPHLPIDVGCVADADPRRRTLMADDRSHLQGRWKGQDLLYPIPHGTHTITVRVANAEDGFAMRLELPQWFTRPWGRVDEL